MDQNNFLLDESNIDGSYQLRLKLKYLQEDKEKLEISNKQMNQNIMLLREINKQLSQTNSLANENILIKKLQQQNMQLERAYLRILDENNALTCRNLMFDQIIHESQNQHRQILKGYQNKIIQLRRSIQFKQSCIQTYEQNTPSNNNGYEGCNIPPSNISMVFFNQIDEYKSNIVQLETKNKTLESQVKSLKEKIGKIEDEKLLIESMVSTRYGYNKFKDMFNSQFVFNQPRLRSEQKISFTRTINNANRNIQQLSSPFKPKNLTSKKQKQTFLSTQPQQTRQISYQCRSGNFKLNQIKQQLKKKNFEYCKLAISFRKQHTKRKQNDQKIKVLVKSNKYYKEKRQTNMDELNYYKRATSDLLRLLEKRKVKRQYSVDKTQIDKIIMNIKKPHQIEILHNDKRYWKKVQTELKLKIDSKTKSNLQTINRTRLKKSLSDILDYTELCHDDDKIDKYYQSKFRPNMKKVKNNSKYQSSQTKEIPSNNNQNLDDFSQILSLGVNGQIFDDQTLIIKPKVMSYADRKKIKTKSASIDANNLTIIRQNVL